MVHGKDNLHLPSSCQNMEKLGLFKEHLVIFWQPKSLATIWKKLPNGFDIYYVLDGLKGTEKQKAATLRERKSGRVLKLWTIVEGLQFYTSKGSHMWHEKDSLSMKLMWNFVWRLKDFLMWWTIQILLYILLRKKTLMNTQCCLSFQPNNLAIETNMIIML